MQSCNQGAELGAHLGLISDGCKSVPTKRSEGNAKAMGILPGFLQLSQAGLRAGGMQSNALQENWGIHVKEFGSQPWDEAWVPQS